MSAAQGTNLRQRNGLGVEGLSQTGHTGIHDHWARARPMTAIAEADGADLAGGRLSIPAGRRPPNGRSASLRAGGRRRYWFGQDRPRIKISHASKLVQNAPTVADATAVFDQCGGA